MLITELTRMNKNEGKCYKEHTLTQHKLIQHTLTHHLLHSKMSNRWHTDSYIEQLCGDLVAMMKAFDLCEIYQDTHIPTKRNYTIILVVYRIVYYFLKFIFRF